MAIVKWKASAYRLFIEYVESARQEYGKKNYNPSTNIVRIVDIWDTRMNPETLKKRVSE